MRFIRPGQALREYMRFLQPQMADNASFFLDTREPHMVADFGAITLSTTDKALYTSGQFPPLGANYFGRGGKRAWMRLGGKITTAATPGNGTFDIYWGNGTDTNGTILASSAAQTLIASQTAQSWWLDFMVRCTAIGASGALEIAVGKLWFSNAVVSGGFTTSPLIPASGAAPVTVDLTAAASIISVQFKRSGSTAETMTVQDLCFVPMN